MHPEWRRDTLVVTTDPDRVDLDAVHAFLTESYWSEGHSARGGAALDRERDPVQPARTARARPGSRAS
jgi:hypothetical protein